MKNKLLFLLSCFAVCAALMGFALGIYGQALPGTSTLGLSNGSASVSAPYLTVGGVVYGPVFPFTAPTLTGWTAENSASLTTSAGYLFIEAAATSGVSMRGIYRTGPGGTYTRTYLFRPDITGGLVAGGEIMWAVGWRESSTGKIVTAHSGWSGGAVVAQLDYWNSITSVNTSAVNNVGVSMGAQATQREVWLRIQDDGTNLKVYTGVDPNNWFQVYSVLRGAFMSGSGPDQLFLGLYPNSGSARMAVYSMQ